MTRVLWVASLVLAAAVQAGPSSAQAEMFFRNGKRLLKLGKISEACSAFDASEKLDPTISTRLNQANCREKNSQLATAWGLFLDAERDTRNATDDAGKQLHQIAVEHADKLEARLSTLEIRVSAEVRVDGLEILRDGEVVDPMAWNQSLPIDGGVYKIVAHAKNDAEWSTTVAIANEKDNKTVEIPKRALKDTKKPAPIKPPVATTAKTVAPDNWYCTQSNHSKIGACKPQLDQCEAFRDRMLGQVHDLVACAAAATATCFAVNGDPHCAPTSEICDAMHDAATRAGTAAVGSCDKLASKSAPKEVPKAPAKATGKTEDVDFDEPAANGPTWACTESKRSPVGTCKATVDQCEAFRAKMLERFQDLSECHPVAKAQCFDLGKEPRCAPSAEICDAMREAAKVSGQCSARAVK
jgi:hypothetical protein